MNQKTVHKLAKVLKREKLTKNQWRNFKRKYNKLSAVQKPKFIKAILQISMLDDNRFKTKSHRAERPNGDTQQ